MHLPYQYITSCCNELLNKHIITIRVKPNMRLNLDVNDRQQRARRVENALRDGSRWKILDENYSAFRKVILDGTEETTNGLFNPSVGIAPFFKAALLIRNNYANWIEYINNIAEYPPVIFEPFAGNNQLVMLLFV